MNRLDLIIDALENSEPNGTGWVHVHEQKHQAALAAARELRELKPVAWCVERKVATCNEKYAELWRSNRERVTPLYALDEVTK